MFGALLLLAAIAPLRPQALNLAGDFVVDREARLAAFRRFVGPGGPNPGAQHFVNSEGRLPVGLDLTGRYAFFADWLVQIDLHTGQLRALHLYDVKDARHKFLWPSEQDIEQDPYPVFSSGVDTITNRRLEAINEDSVVGGHEDAFWLSYRSHGGGQGYAYVDVEHPAQGTIYFWLDPGNYKEPPMEWLPDRDGQGWLGAEPGLERRDSKFRLVWRSETNLRESQLAWYSKQGLAYSMVFGGHVPKAAIQKVGKGNLTVLKELPIPSEPGGELMNEALLSSRRFLVCIGIVERKHLGGGSVSNNFTGRYNLYLSDKALTRWKLIGHYFLRGASVDGKHVLLTGPQVTDPAWVVQFRG